MFIQYLGGGIGHSANTADIETPAALDDEPDGNPDDRPERGPDNQGEGGDKVASENEDSEHTGYSEENIEDGGSDEEELDNEL